MAVFTPVQMSEISPWLKSRGIIAHAIDGIGEGIENTNYRIRADDESGGRRDYVFTIFELWDIKQVRYYAALTGHFTACGLPVAAPVFAPSLWNDDKPCILVPFVKSEGWQENPSAEQCNTMGAMIAKLHLAAASFDMPMTNPRGAHWRRDVIGSLQAHLPPALMRLANEEINRDGSFSAAPLPFGACHGDLFRNNVLWRGDDIVAVIDFYFGGGDALIFDIAVAACDWCFVDGGFDKTKLDALFDGYLRLRRLCALERAMLADAFCVAALRFWLSRLYDMHYPRRARVLQAHDPRYFENILLAARDMRDSLTAAVKAT